MVWGTLSPEAEAVCRHCLQILSAETIKIRKFHSVHLLILDQYVLWSGAERHFGGCLAPSPSGDVTVYVIKLHVDILPL